MTNFDISMLYTDTCNIYRVVVTDQNGITSNERQQVLTNVPCRVYKYSHSSTINQGMPVYQDFNELRICCDSSYKIQEGDEVEVTRGAYAYRTFLAGVPLSYDEVLGIQSNLAHQEVPIVESDRVVLV